MVAVNLEQVQGLEDTLLTHRFSIEFPALPGGGDPAGLTVRCQQLVFPGSAINPVETILHGFKRQEFGRKEHPGQMQATFVETRSMPTWSALKAWQEQIRGTRSGSSAAPRASLALTPTVTVYDEMDQAVGMCQVFSCWPQDVPEVQLDGSSDTQFLINVTFAYDYIEYPNLITVR